MSQSDYIKYKRVASNLKRLHSNLNESINESSYIDYKEFCVININNKLSDKLRYNKIIPSGTIDVFSMKFNNHNENDLKVLCNKTCMQFLN